MKKIIIIPDVHGRTFWRNPVSESLTESETNIVFLGDYTSCYPEEFEEGVDYKRLSIEMLKEIVEIKKANPSRITLLLGNHDLGHIDDSICSCRTDYKNMAEIANILLGNRQLFQIAEETDINGKHFIFSHAGIFKGWCHRAFGKLADKENFNPVNALNNAWLAGDEMFMIKLGIYDNYRGYGGAIYGSPVWADICAWGKAGEEDTYGYNIVGHTQLNKRPIIMPVIADLDCRRAFYINDKGEIKEYEETQENDKQDLETASSSGGDE